jgi:hypothetical protein
MGERDVKTAQHISKSRAPTPSYDLLVTPHTYHKNDRANGWPLHRLKRADWILAFAILLGAMLVRWPLIDRGHTLLHSDESIVGIMAQDIAAGRHFPVYFYGQRYMGALEAYVVAALTPICHDPIHALRLAPAIFFAIMTAAQYLMLTRWLGRRGGLVGAASLLAASPMMAQWSISARGGYIEIMAIGTLLLLAYGEWFAARSASPTRRQRLAFGVLIGLGLWINPSIVIFIAPIVAHQLLDRPLARAARLGIVNRSRRSMGRATLAIVLTSLVLVINIAMSTWVDNGAAKTQILLGLFPKPVAIAILGLVATSIAISLARTTTLLADARTLLFNNSAMILGVLIGAAPALFYLAMTVVGAQTMEPALPLGLRPIWRTGETLTYLLHGLPLLLGADPRAFLQLISVGRESALRPSDLMMSAALVAANWFVLGAIFTCSIAWLHGHRDELAQLLRLRAKSYSPAMFLLIGGAGTVLLYLLGGCVVNFTSIRYLLPMWVFVPGLLASTVCRFDSPRLNRLAAFAPWIAIFGWTVGQAGMYTSLGRPHPLHTVADRLVEKKVERATAELLDAHLLTYMTGQACKVAEYEPFWPRLMHVSPPIKSGPATYLVNTRELDRENDWRRGAFPGKSPPETKRILWPRLRRQIERHPETLVSREALADGFELITLTAPLVKQAGIESRLALR